MNVIAARASVHAVSVRQALDLLTEIAAPLRISITLAPDVAILATHGEDGWWASVRVPAESETTERASAAVPRLEFRQAVDAEAVLVADASCSITMVDGDVVRYGAFAFAAIDAVDFHPPSIEGDRTAISTHDVQDGRVALPDGRTFQIPDASLDRFLARRIDTVEIVDAEPSPCLVGVEAGEGVAGPLELVLVALGRWT